LPDGVAQALDDYLRETPSDTAKSNGQLPEHVAGKLFGDLCPECGEAAVVNEEGCRKCYSCGFSEC
jgi:ribonucleoside-diphosphate reductase alpha chain